MAKLSSSWREISKILIADSMPVMAVFDALGGDVIEGNIRASTLCAYGDGAGFLITGIASRHTTCDSTDRGEREERREKREEREERGERAINRSGILEIDYSLWGFGVYGDGIAWRDLVEL